MLILRDVHLRFNDSSKPLLEGIDLTLRQGETTGITGPSGGGKTLLGLVASGVIPGLIDADVTGEITRKAENSEQGTRAAIVFQDPSFQLFSRTVREELLFTPRKLGWPDHDVQADFDTITSGLHLEPLLDASPRELSMGEIQRVAVGVALMQRPQVLILDEPTQYMDVFHVSATLRFVVERARATGSAVLLIEHHIDMLETYCDQVLEMRDGHLGEFSNGFGPFQQISFQPDDIHNHPHIELHNVYYQYTADCPVLQDVSCAVSKGDVLAVLGPNGGGKSTLAKVCCGLYKPQKGTVTHHDQPVRPTVSWYRNAGFVMQNPDQQMFAPTVIEECLYGPRNFGVPDAEARDLIGRLLADFGMDGYEARDPFSLSYGEKRRINIIGALAYNPHVLILDEPTCALDRKNQEILLDQIARINKEGKTIIVITHDLTFARAACNQALFVRDGAVIRTASMTEIGDEDARALYTV